MLDDFNIHEYKLFIPEALSFLTFTSQVTFPSTPGYPPTPMKTPGFVITNIGLAKSRFSPVK